MIDKIIHPEKITPSIERATKFLTTNTDLPAGLVDTMFAKVTKIDTTPLDFMEGKDISPKVLKDSLTFIHLTNYPPTDGCILPQADVFRGQHLTSDQRYGENAVLPPRVSVHTTIGWPVISHSLSSWSDCQYAVVMDGRAIKTDWITKTNFSDTYGMGPIEFGKHGQIIDIKNNNGAEKQAILETINHGVLDLSTADKIFNLLELQQLKSGGIETYKYMLESVISQDGKVNIVNLMSRLKPDDIDPDIFAALSKSTDLKVSRYLESPLAYCAIKSVLAQGHVPIPRGIRPDQSFISIFGERQNGVIGGTESPENSRKIIDVIGAKYDHQSGGGHGITNSPWAELENIWTQAIRGRKSFGGVDILNIESTTIIDRLKNAVDSVKIGGSIWKKVLKENLPSIPRLIYAAKTLMWIEQEFKDELKLATSHPDIGNQKGIGVNLQSVYN